MKKRILITLLVALSAYMILWFIPMNLGKLLGDNTDSYFAGYAISFIGIPLAITLIATTYKLFLMLIYWIISGKSLYKEQYIHHRKSYDDLIFFKMKESFISDYIKDQRKSKVGHLSVSDSSPKKGWLSK